MFADRRLHGPFDVGFRLHIEDLHPKDLNTRGEKPGVSTASRELAEETCVEQVPGLLESHIRYSGFGGSWGRCFSSSDFRIRILRKVRSESKGA